MFIWNYVNLSLYKVFILSQKILIQIVIVWHFKCSIIIIILLKKIWLQFKSADLKIIWCKITILQQYTHNKKDQFVQKFFRSKMTYFSARTFTGVTHRTDRCIPFFIVFAPRAHNFHRKVVMLGICTRMSDVTVTGF